MRVLALDPGTSCGWALYDTITCALTSGSWDLSIGKDESSDVRLLRLQASLSTMLPLALLVYEAAKEARFAKAVRVQGQIEGALMLWARQQTPPVPYYGVNPATVLAWLLGKKYITRLRAWQKAVVAAGLKKPNLKTMKMWVAKTDLDYHAVDDHDQMDAYVLACFVVQTKLPAFFEEQAWEI